jgi:hypothetical protein
MNSSTVRATIYMHTAPDGTWCMGGTYTEKRGWRKSRAKPPKEEASK